MADISVNTSGTTAAVFGLVGGVRKDIAASDASATNKTDRLHLDSGGNVRVTQEGGKATYTAVSNFSCDSTATDIAVFPGSATKTVKIKKIVLTTVATALAAGDLSIVRRSTANTAGTTAAAALARFDQQTDGAPTAAPIHYTAAPSGLGTAVATAWAQRIVQGATATVPSTLVTIDFEAMNGGRALTLRGTADRLAIHVPAALGAAGNAWDINWVFTEEGTDA